jgi:hypothetical protein
MLGAKMQANERRPIQALPSLALGCAYWTGVVAAFTKAAV